MLFLKLKLLGYSSKLIIDNYNLLYSTYGMNKYDARSGKTDIRIGLGMIC